MPTDRFSSEELGRLRELMQSYPVDDPPGVEAAQRTIQSRYTALGEGQAGAVIRDHLEDAASIAHTASGLVRILHGVLFAGIHSKAGEFRDYEDAGGWRVYFGRVGDRGPEFSGAHPDEIDSQVRSSTSLLVRDPDSPVWNAIQFYQRFVNAHPFHDANGRVGRLIVTYYLDVHGLHIQWKELLKTTELRQRLNRCHRLQESGHRYEEYMEYLVNHCRRHVIRQEDLVGDEGGED